jgi:hypothetical protein
MSDTSQDLQKVKEALEEHKEQMSLFARAFSPVMMLLLAYIILALVGFVPGFPGMNASLVVWVVVRFGVQFLHPDLRRLTDLQKAVLQLQTQSDE